MSRLRRKESRAPRNPAAAWTAGRRRGHVAVRTCAGCGQTAPRAAMCRIARGPGSSIEWRDHGGRGTYLHPVAECERLFVESRRALRGLRLRPDETARRELLEGKAARA